MRKMSPHGRSRSVQRVLEALHLSIVGIVMRHQVEYTPIPVVKQDIMASKVFK
jgi:hypothetical protein